MDAEAVSTHYSPKLAAETLALGARLAIESRSGERPLEPESAAAVSGFDVELPRRERDPREVLRELDRAAEPGLVGTTQPGFMGWVIGGSHPAGIAADWMATAWGQNACLYDSSRAAAEAEATSASWLLDMLDLPREASVGFTTGATMAAFTCLAAARLAVLERAGHDFEKSGLYGCPEIAVYICDDAHVTNYAALRYLGFGSDQLRRVPANEHGTYDLDALERQMHSDRAEARIVVGQAGHIMSGAFDDFSALSRLCKRFGAWLHVDGAFGMWVRASKRLKVLSQDSDLADSWSVDGHKWLQIPYDCGFAIVRHEEIHRRAMSMQAGYLTEMPEHRNNTDYVPELSRRARGFSVWAVMQSLGRLGISDIVERHCDAAHRLATALRRLNGVTVVNRIHLNQLAVAFDGPSGCAGTDVAIALNAQGRYFVRTAEWRGRTVLRFSIINGATSEDDITDLVASIEHIWQALNRAAA